MTPDNLNPEDSMAHSFLSRAANAIVRASDLSIQLADVSDKLSHASEALDTLNDIKRTQEERIALLEAQLERTIIAEGEAQQARMAAEETAAARQRDIDLLDHTVERLKDELEVQGRQLDDALAKSDLQDAALAKLTDIHNAIRHAMGQGDLDPDPREEIEAACAVSPSDEEIGDGRDDPEYRREPSEASSYEEQLSEDHRRIWESDDDIQLAS